MKVYLVCRDIDLGYHVEYVYSKPKHAYDKCEDLDEEYKSEKLQELINIGYSTEKAESFVTGVYFVEEHEVLNDV